MLFDLDGTFADTAPDLADALNRTLAANHRAPLPFEKIRPVVSHGGRALIELGFGIKDSDSSFEALRRQLLDYYQADIARHTQLFPGILELLHALQRDKLQWGIVTNKPGWLTTPLLASLALPFAPCSVVSGDTLPQRKPDPAPLVHASAICGCDPAACLYIGDAERDIVAGKRAGMQTMAALYGYIRAEDTPQQWQADSYIEHPEAIYPWIHAYNELQLQNTRYAE
ncbi:MAG: HAD-IA family hydrolase [Gammaproteobacteria bacterium]|nr:HAD-IA family hydrolase [Gammaproteobacteria bacterium]